MNHQLCVALLVVLANCVVSRRLFNQIEFMQNGIMGYQESGDSPAGYESHPQTDCTGNDLDDTTASNAVECAKKCASFPNCVAFQFNVLNQCYPKYQCDQLKNNADGNIYTVMYNADGYNCGDNNPCSPANTAANGYYYPDVDPRQFVQCDYAGECYELSCPPGLVYDEAAFVCVDKNQK